MTSELYGQTIELSVDPWPRPDPSAVPPDSPVWDYARRVGTATLTEAERTTTPRHGIVNAGNGVHVAFWTDYPPRTPAIVGVDTPTWTIPDDPFGPPPALRGTRYRPGIEAWLP